MGTEQSERLFAAFRAFFYTIHAGTGNARDDRSFVQFFIRPEALSSAGENPVDFRQETF